MKQVVTGDSRFQPSREQTNFNAILILVTPNHARLFDVQDIKYHGSYVEFRSNILHQYDTLVGLLENHGSDGERILDYLKDELSEVSRQREFYRREMTRYRQMYERMKHRYVMDTGKEVGDG